jgi:hypothetical protein
MRVRLLVTVSVLALLGAACTGSTGPTPAEPLTPDRPVSLDSVLLGTPDGPVIVQVPTGSVVFDGSGALSSLGGAWVLSAVASEEETVLETREGSSGQVVSTTRVSGELEPRIVSESGRAVALMRPLPPGWDPAVPLPRARTTIVVADPSGAREPRTFRLEGNFEPEAFSTDDDSLFLIQHLPAETPTAYRVTMLDLVREKIRPVFGPFKGPAERMPGTRLSQLLSPDADQLYTLYTSAKLGYAPHGAPVASDASVSFVHVLSLQDGWAHCVGLPKAMWNRPADEQAMATTPDGSYLYVIDAGQDLAAVMHTTSLRVSTVDVDLPFEGAISRTSAQMSPDGEALYVAAAGDDTEVATAGDDGSTIVALDPTTLRVLDTWRLAGSVSGLGVSSDGESVYAAVGGRVVVLDASTGREIDEVLLPTDQPIDRVTALAA